MGRTRGLQEGRTTGGQAGSKDDKQTAGQARPVEVKQRARLVGGQVGSKVDKTRARQVGAVWLTLNCARGPLASDSTKGIRHTGEECDEVEPAGSLADEEEQSTLQYATGPSPDELRQVVLLGFRLPRTLIVLLGARLPRPLLVPLGSRLPRLLLVLLEAHLPRPPLVLLGARLPCPLLVPLGARSPRQLLVLPGARLPCTLLVLL